MRHWQSGTMIRRFCTDAGWTTTGTPGARSPACRKKFVEQAIGGSAQDAIGKAVTLTINQICTRSIYRAYTNTQRTATPACSAAATTTASRRTLHPAGRCQGHRRSGGRVPEHHRCGQRRHGQCHGLRQHGGGFLSPATTPATTPGRSAHRSLASLLDSDEQYDEHGFARHLGHWWRCRCSSAASAL